jgi:flagellar M-ring protein FliF
VPAPGAPTAGTTTDKTSEQATTDFEVPETYTSTKKAPGTVKKLVVATVVEGRYQTSEEGGEKTYVPLESAESDTYRQLVTAAVGLDETRGDVITINDMPFEEAAIEMELPGLPWYAGVPVAQIVLGVVAVVAFVLLRSVLSKMAAAPPTPLPELAPVPEYPVTEEAALKERVKEEISRLSREQPEAVASVLRTWLAEE